MRCRDVEDIMGRYPWCDIKSIVWSDSKPQWRACFPQAQGYLSSQVVTRVIYKELIYKGHRSDGIGFREDVT